MFFLIPWFQPQPYTVHLPLLDASIDLQPFGLLVWIGTILGIMLASRIGREQGLDDFLLRDLVFHCVLYGFIGAYFLNVIFYEWDEAINIVHDPKLLLTHWLGLSSVGGIISGAFGALVWKWRRKQTLIPYIDSVCAGLVLGLFFGRIGCFIVHDHPGRVSNFFLAVDDFHTGFPPFQPRHDLGFYEAIFLLGLIAIFFLFFRRRDLQRGVFPSFALFYYAPIRLALDFLRAPDAEGGDARYAGFTPAQYTCVGFLALAAWLYWRSRTLARTETGIQRSNVTLSPPASGGAAENSKSDPT